MRIMILSDMRYYKYINELYLKNKREKYDYCIKNGIDVNSIDLDKGYDLKYFESYVNDNNKGIIVGDLPEFYGYIFFKIESIDEKKYMVITEFEVNKKFKNMLIGTTLIEMLLSYADNSVGWKSDYLKINVSMFNDEMIKFLENLDFVINKDNNNEYEMIKEVNSEGLEKIHSLYKSYYDRRDNNK